MDAQESVRGTITTLNIDETARESLSLHWSGIFAGLFVSLLTYFALMSLGLALGAGVVKDVLTSDEVFNGIAIGAGVWTIGSVLFALFMGSYASGRASGIIATRIGYTQGAVITALFFAIMISQVGASMGILTRNIANISSSAVGTSIASQVANPALRALVEDNLGAAQLKSPPQIVITGLIQRLMRGDMNSATTYFAAQTGVSKAEAQARINALDANFKITLERIAQRGSVAASRLGWAAFVTLFFGTLAAMLGGGTGALVNLRKPIDRVDERAMRRIPAYT